MRGSWSTPLVGLSNATVTRMEDVYIKVDCASGGIMGTSRRRSLLLPDATLIFVALTVTVECRVASCSTFPGDISSALVGY